MYIGDLFNQNLQYFLQYLFIVACYLHSNILMRGGPNFISTQN